MILYNNRVRLDEEKWNSIILESEQELNRINEDLNTFKNKLLLNKFDENRRRVHCFKSIKIDTNLEYMSINRLVIFMFYFGLGIKGQYLHVN